MAKNNNKIKTQLKVGDLIFKYAVIAILILYAFSLCYVVFWLIMSSFKQIDDFILYPMAWPKKFRFENYIEIMSKFSITQNTAKGVIRYGFGEMFSNSLIYSAAASSVNVIWNTICGFVLSKYRSKFTNFIYTVGVVVMVLPIVGSFPSSMLLWKNLGIYDNMLARFIIGPACSFSGLHFLIMYGVFKDMPNEYRESVEIDGGTHFTAMFKVYIPLAIPSIIVLFVMNFIGSWNDYGTFLLWLPSTPNLAYGMYRFEQLGNALQIGRPLIFAGFVIVSIPSVILYLVSQNTIMTKFAVGGIKG